MSLPSFRQSVKVLIIGAGLVGLAGGCVRPQLVCNSFTPVLTPADTTLCRNYNGSLNYDALVRERTVGWEMNNILFSSSDKSLNKFKNIEESTMEVEAVLYDFTLIQAELSRLVKADTVPRARAETLYQTMLGEYQVRHHPEKQIRIKIRMRSQFSQKSLDPTLWTIYLADENGDMYEPDSVRPGIMEEKKVERWDNSRRYFRHQFTTEFNAYFPLVTFYKQNLVPTGRKYLKLVLAYQQEVIGEGGWCFKPAAAH